MTAEPLNKEYLDFEYDDDDVISIHADDNSCYTAVARPMHIKSISGATSIAISRTSLSFRSNASSGTSPQSPPQPLTSLLPWEISHNAYRPSEFITLPLPASELQLSGRPVAESLPQRRRSTVSKVFMTVIRQRDVEKYKMVRMRREEYLKYWARDAKGVYIGTEPEGSGMERLRRGLAENREMSLLGSRGW